MMDEAIIRIVMVDGIDYTQDNVVDLPRRACTNQDEKNFQMKLSSDGVTKEYLLC